MASIKQIRKAYQNEVIQKLLGLPAEIEEAENKVIIATNAVEDAKCALLDKETSLYNEGKVEGRNEALRKACLASLTAEEKEVVREKERELVCARKEYSRKLNDFSAMRALSRLLAVQDVI
ncbi:MAG TPA: hypothetical protein GXX59_11440 [Syntrophomonadaceae bacterium]|mgnify:CR=1 FL=1|jgi:hypothetical protein|nr:hypothetical protein [Syntrophomonadaceae bacterium]